MKKIKVLIVDDSVIVRSSFSTILSRDPEIEIVGEASDPYEARDKIVVLKPDVLTLDIHMPRMDGLTFLKKLMKHYPLPVIMVSGVSDENAKITLQALEYGAIEFIAKPTSGGKSALADLSVQLIEKIKIAARVKIRTKKTVLQNIKTLPSSMVRSNNKIIAIGTSTGGTEALRLVLRRMPPNSPPILIVQHMPESFTRSFANSLNDLCDIEVREAKNGDNVTTGLALVAPGNWHMKLKSVGKKYYVNIEQDVLVQGHRPSVEVLFNSVAKHAGLSSIGVLMTGMGADGAQGLLNMKNSKAKTIAQDERSSVVFGMPKEAIKLGAVDKIVSLYNIPETILSML